MNENIPTNIGVKVEISNNRIPITTDMKYIQGGKSSGNKKRKSPKLYL